MNIMKFYNSKGEMIPIHITQNREVFSLSTNNKNRVMTSWEAEKYAAQAGLTKKRPKIKVGL